MKSLLDLHDRQLRQLYRNLMSGADLLPFIVAPCDYPCTIATSGSMVQVRYLGAPPFNGAPFVSPHERFLDYGKDEVH